MTQHLSTTINGHLVELVPMTDDNDPERGTWLECYVHSPDGRHHNSLPCLDDNGEFDDGPKISTATLDRIAEWADANGY